MWPKKRKLEGYTSKMGDYSTDFGVELKSIMLQPVITEALNRSLAKRT